MTQLPLILSLLKKLKNDVGSESKIDIDYNKTVNCTRVKGMVVAMIESLNKEKIHVQRWDFPLNINDVTNLVNRKNELVAKFKQFKKDLMVSNPDFKPLTKVYQWVISNENGDDVNSSNVWSFCKNFMKLDGEKNCTNGRHTVTTIFKNIDIPSDEEVKFNVAFYMIKSGVKEILSEMCRACQTEFLDSEDHTCNDVDMFQVSVADYHLRIPIFKELVEQVYTRIEKFDTDVVDKTDLSYRRSIENAKEMLMSNPGNYDVYIDQMCKLIYQKPQEDGEEDPIATEENLMMYM